MLHLNVRKTFTSNTEIYRQHICKYHRNARNTTTRTTVVDISCVESDITSRFLILVTTAAVSSAWPASPPAWPSGCPVYRSPSTSCVPSSGCTLWRRPADGCSPCSVLSVGVSLSQSFIFSRFLSDFEWLCYGSPNLRFGYSLVLQS